MEENRRDELKGDIPAPVSIKFSEKFENFWYHYKWHTIFTAIALVIVMICTMQMCNKESYDLYIMYAGSHEIKKTASDGDIPAYSSTVSSFKRITEDFDGDGAVNVSLKDLFVLTADEIKEVEANKELEVNYTLISDNYQILKDTVVYSDYYLCFLSASVYEEFKMIDGVAIFTDLTKYVQDDSGVVMHDSSAIYLSSTEFHTLPGISDLPRDTVICVRSVSPMASHWDKDGSQEGFECAIAALKKILAYTA